MLERIYGGDDEPPAAPDRVQCPVCGEMANVESLVTGVWEGEPRCNCPIEPAAPEPLDPVLVETGNYLTAHPETLNVLDRISRFLGKIDRPEDIDLWEFDCFIAAIRAYGKPVTR